MIFAALFHGLAAVWRAVSAAWRVTFGVVETPLVRLFVRAGPGWTTAWMVGVALVLALVSLFFVGFLRLPAASDSAPQKLGLRPVYLAEQAQMRADAPVFATGLRANAVRAWAHIPETGALALTRGDIRLPLERLLPDINDVAGQWAAGGATSRAAAQLVAELKKADDRQRQRDGSADRVAIEYHTGLADLFNGDRQDAEKRMQTVVQLIEARVGPLEDAQQGAPTPPRQADLARLYSAEIAADYALGLAQLSDPGKQSDATASLNAALSLAGAHQDLVAAPADRLSTKLFTLDPATSVVKLDTADIYADLLAATIAAAAQGDKQASGELAFLVSDLQGKSMSGRPKLAVNLEIAALLAGKTDAVGAFTPDASADDPAIPQVTAEVHAAASSNEAVLDLHSYWSVVHSWRTDLANGDAADIRKQLAQQPKELAPERAWLGEVLNDAYDDLKSPGERARFIQQYGDLLQGVSIFRSLEANMPLARYVGLPGWLATGVTFALAALLWLIFAHAILVSLRTREPWRVIYGSGYAADYRAHRPEAEA
ncbi:MAG TPA: hypothetical protein VHW60_16710 [Caulobacteraceae bacterium]|nr:hypothetical protein [Caulobacteraceae bacterium]